MLRVGSGLILTSLVLMLASGCGAQAPKGSHQADQLAQKPDAMLALHEPTSPAERKIIYTSQMELLVDDLAAAQRRLAEMLKSIQAAGGYVAKQEVAGQQGAYGHGSWTIRIPLATFDGFVTEVASLGELKRDTLDAQDVTEAYADLDARLRNQMASESRLLAHLQKTEELKDTLEVEREITRVRGEIERLQGQLNLLRNKTDLATVNLTLIERESIIPTTATAFSTQVSRTFQTSIDALVTFAQAIILALVTLSPWLVVAAVIATPILVVRRIMFSRRISNRG